MSETRERKVCPFTTAAWRDHPAHYWGADDGAVLICPGNPDDAATEPRPTLPAYPLCPHNVSTAPGFWCSGCATSPTPPTDDREAGA